MSYKLLYSDYTGDPDKHTLFAINQQQKFTLGSYRQCSKCCPSHSVLLTVYEPPIINKHFICFVFFFSKFVMSFE